MNYETVLCTIVATTDEAILIEGDFGELWVPRSQVEDGWDVEDFNDQGSLEIASWLCDVEGLL